MSKRRAITVLETIVALVCLGVAATLVGQVAVWSIGERARADTRLAAIEWAANVLERANASRWEELNEAWAAKQTLPEELSERMVKPVVTVQLETDEQLPNIKRMNVRVQWFHTEGEKAPTVELMTLFANRPGAP